MDIVKKTACKILSGAGFGSLVYGCADMTFNQPNIHNGLLVIGGAVSATIALGLASHIKEQAQINAQKRYEQNELDEASQWFNEYKKQNPPQEIVLEKYGCDENGVELFR